MSIHAWRLAGLTGPVLLLAACGWSQQGRTTRLLDHRMQTRLQADIATNRAAMQPLPDGVQVTLLSTSMFPNSIAATEDQYPDIRATVIEGLLDPALMRVQVVDTSSMPDDQRALRVHNVVRYFAENGLGSVIRQVEPPTAQPTTAAPPGLTITIRVVCPPPHGGFGYGSGQADPACY
jgi:hypothetical protein